VYRHTVEVDGDADYTRVVGSDEYTMISFVFYTRCVNRRWSNTIAPVDTSATRKQLLIAST